MNHKANDKFQFGISARYLNQIIDGSGTTGSGTRTTNRLRHSVQYRPYELPGALPEDQFDEEFFV